MNASTSSDDLWLAGGNAFFQEIARARSPNFQQSVTVKSTLSG
jgi:hypothetical protein